MKIILLIYFILCFTYIIRCCPQVSPSCCIFGSGDEWNRVISSDEVDPMSDCYVASISSTANLHPDFGSIYGIPFTVVNSTQPLVPILFAPDGYPDESDQWPFPIPPNAPIEGGSDAHVIVVDKDNCTLYELYSASFANDPEGSNSWLCYSAAYFDLKATDFMRPAGWTSADAAGLPIFPGLARYEDVATGSIDHALRFTGPTAPPAYTYPGNHFGPSDNTDINLPPYGTRFRLKSSYDISGLTGQSLIIAQALKTYGIIFADQGSAWYITGSVDTRWDDDDLNQIKGIPGNQFEAVVSPFPIVREWNPSGPIVCNPSSGSQTSNQLIYFYFRLMIEVIFVSVILLIL